MKRFQPFVFLSLLLLLIVGAAACSSSKKETAVGEGQKRTALLQPNDDFVNDSLALVGKTGKPQLIELFAFT